MSRVRPILFNSEMVRATLDDRKTVTRRIAKKIPVETHRVEPIQSFINGKMEFECHWGGYQPDTGSFVDGMCIVKPPYQPGDILYVRETYYKGKNCIFYKASNPNLTGYRSMDGEDVKIKWRPFIYMPKKAARIWLKVTDVGVERLQEITEEGIWEEGFQFVPPCLHQVTEESYCDLDGPCTSNIKYCSMSIGDLFGTILWNSTIKKPDLDRYGWEANPWVWVIEFERCERPAGWPG